MQQAYDLDCVSTRLGEAASIAMNTGGQSFMRKESKVQTGLKLPQVLTPGLKFREWRKGDAPGLARFMTQPSYNRWLAVRMQSAAELDVMVKRHLKRLSSNDRRHFRLCATDISTNELIADGFIWLLGGDAAEIGWGVDPDVWNCGVGTQMGEVLCAMAIERLGAKDVWCKVMSPNLASGHIARSLGFKLEKTVTSGATGLNRTHDVDIYKLTATDYFERGYAI